MLLGTITLRIQCKPEVGEMVKQSGLFSTKLCSAIRTQLDRSTPACRVTQQPSTPATGNLVWFGFGRELVSFPICTVFLHKAKLASPYNRYFSSVINYKY